MRMLLRLNCALDYEAGTGFLQIHTHRVSMGILWRLMFALLHFQGPEHCAHAEIEDVFGWSGAGYMPLCIAHPGH